jgi:hypothetical protein
LPAGQAPIDCYFNSKQVCGESLDRIGNRHFLVQRPIQEDRFPMLWTCPQCGAAVDASADRCWACKQLRPGPEPGSQTMSKPVPEPGREVATADEATESTSEMAATRSWTCSKCGETIDAGFLVCWSCGTSIEGVEDPSFFSTQDTALGDDQSEEIAFLDDEHEEPNPAPTPTCCIRCQGPLEPGFIADFQHGNTAMKPSEWVAGTPQPSFWTGTWTGNRRFPIQAFRCSECGHLEFWAGAPADID